MCNKQYLSQRDLAVLHRFAREHGIDAGCSDPAGRRLAGLLAAAIPLPETDEAQDRVGLGATVHYRPAGARDLSTILIACPYDANALLARVTILSPLALGLLGHAVGCTVAIGLPLARSLPVDIVAVEAPTRTPGAAPWLRGLQDAPPPPVSNLPERRSP
ncbi:GreA/GreB family elongation factor [Massilia sp. X63]|uniref:GreA/GreB family elongation factor n=1 Tax=Massilia sp. X63 TaxID=3237285 RepID=UPI0034DD1C07